MGERNRCVEGCWEVDVGKWMLGSGCWEVDVGYVGSYALILVLYGNVCITRARRHNRVGESPLAYTSAFLAQGP